jgi:prepilin-type N-terminal cleavage/methylation domain-containing protein/prepilin-type processing-associated H-X9-DG protein
MNPHIHVLRRPRSAFSLIELLLVIGILAVLAGLVASGVMRARFAAERSDCQSRLRNQVAAIFNYESREGHLPPGTVSGPFAPLKVPDGANHSLWATLLADLDQPAAASAYHWDVNFDDPRNQSAVSLKIPVLLCPTGNPDRTEDWSRGRFGGVADYGPVDVNPFLADIAEIDPSEDFEGALPVNGTVHLTDIGDGASQTILVAEAAGRPGLAWSSPSISISIKFILGGTAHLGGANVAMCDGSVHFFKPSTDLKLLAKLATRSGGESGDSDW